ncbi:hypothetical protein [Arcobacter arenosus]|uniref:hypothetical protein n=1 Tax=Arcobacter arenosus TaxID=2576037 RepID=UPI003BAD1D29
MKKLLLFFFIFIVATNLSAQKTSDIWIRTSQPDYSKMTVVDTSASTTTVLKIKKVNGKNKYVTLTEAFKEFHLRNISTIQKFIQKNKYDGVCNLKIEFNITKDGYYFLSTYDAYVYKK